MYTTLILLLNSLIIIVLSQNCTVDIIHPEILQRNKSHVNLGLNSLTFYLNLNLTGIDLSLNLSDDRCFNYDFEDYQVVDVGYNCFEAYSEDNCVGTLRYLVPGKIHLSSVEMKSIIPCRFDTRDVNSDEHNKINSSRYVPAYPVVKPEMRFFESFFDALCRHEWVVEMNRRVSDTSVRDPRFISWDFLYDGNQTTFMDIYSPNYVLPAKSHHQYRDVLLCAIYILQHHKYKIDAADMLQLRDIAREVISLTDTGVQNRWCSILFLKAIIELIHN